MVPRRSEWGISPRASIEAACRDRGTEDVIAGCLALVAGGSVDPGLVQSLGGPGAAWYLDAPEHQRYWLRVWGARGLLWAWDDRATRAIVAALGDDAWRVREMAAKVVARHLVDAALTMLLELRHDPVPRQFLHESLPQARPD